MADADVGLDEGIVVLFSLVGGSGGSLREVAAALGGSETTGAVGIAGRGGGGVIANGVSAGAGRIVGSGVTGVSTSARLNWDGAETFFSDFARSASATDCSRDAMTDVAFEGNVDTTPGPAEDATVSLRATGAGAIADGAGTGGIADFASSSLRMASGRGAVVFGVSGGAG